MKKYLLDTDICVFFLQGKYNIKDKILENGLENCFISEITIAELKYGAIKSKNRKKHLKEVDLVIELFAILPIFDSLDMYAIEKVRLQNQGKLISDFDLLIGATAITNDMIMVSNNEKHLSRISNIKLENWTKG